MSSPATLTVYRGAVRFRHPAPAAPPPLMTPATLARLRRDLLPEAERQRLLRLLAKVL